MSPRGIRASIAAALLAATAAGAAPPAALACSCAIPSAATVNRADVVFTGTVTTRSDPNADGPIFGSADPVTYGIAVDGELKGDVDDTVQVVTPRDGASCGVDFEVGRRYLVLADRPDAGGALTTGLCQGTQALPAGEPLPEFARGLDAPPPAPSPVVPPPSPWPAPRPVSTPAEGTEAPRLALSPAGEATVVWSRTTYVPGSESLATSRLLAAVRSPGGTFGAPEVISADGELAVLGTAAAAGDARVAVWVGLRGGSSGPAVVARARPLGGPWGSPETLETASPGTGLPQPRVAGNGAGDALAVWATEDRGLRAAAFTSAGGWGQPLTIAADVVSQQLSVALGPDGSAIVAWWARTDGGAVARAAMRAPGGAWAPPVTLSRSFEVLGDLFPSEPPHASASAGEGLVVWTEPRRTFRGSIHAARMGSDGVRGRWRLSTGPGAGGAEAGLDAAGRATVVWSQARGPRAGLRWSSQSRGGRWSPARAIPTTGSACEGGFAPRVAVTPDGVVHAVWMEGHRRGAVVVASARRPGEGFARRAAISRAGASPPAALAVSEAGAAAAWSRASPGARTRPFIEAAVRGPAGAPAAAGLRQFPVPRLADVRVPARIRLRAPVPIAFRLSRPARVEVRFTRVRPSTRHVGPFRRGGRTGANLVTIPSWGPSGRRLGVGVYDVVLQTSTAERTSCTVTRRLVVRG